MKSNLVDIEMQLHAKTERAVLVSDNGDKEKAKWLPLSQIEVEIKGKIVVVTMPEWLAIEKELI